MITLSLTPGTEIAATDDVVTVRHPARGEVVLRGLRRATIAALLQLPHEPPAPPEPTPELQAQLDRLAGWGLLRLHCADLLTASLTSELGTLRLAPVPAGPLRLSRLAYLHRDGDELVASSPLTFARVTIHRPGLLPPLLTGAPLPAGSPLPSGGPAPEPALALLLGAGILTSAAGAETAAEDERPEVRQREFADLLLHNASRRGLTDGEIGALYPYAGELPPEPALREPAGPLVPPPTRHSCRSWSLAVASDGTAPPR
jgi:hypothetical protein